jgi:hypothetical protein
MTRPTKSKLDPAIHRVRLDRLTIFEITEAELEALERGSPESLFLNLGIASLSFASSFFISLLTTTIEDVRTFCVFVIVTVAGFVAGITFALLWWQSRRSLRNVAAEIRRRMPPEGEQELTTSIDRNDVAQVDN